LLVLACVWSLVPFPTALSIMFLSLTRLPLPNCAFF
jgi:hypothetical protein